MLEEYATAHHEISPCVNAPSSAIAGCALVSPDSAENWLPLRLPETPHEQTLFVERLLPLIQKIVRGRRSLFAAEEDLVQDVFLRIVERFHQYSGQVPLVRWVARIAVNTCLTQIRAEQHRRELRHADLTEEQLAYILETTAEGGKTPAEDVSSKEQLDSYLSRLTAEDRLILYLLHVEHHSVEQVSDITGLTCGNVKVRAMRARRKLRKVIERDEAFGYCEKTHCISSKKG